MIPVLRFLLCIAMVWLVIAFIFWIVPVSAAELRGTAPYLVIDSANKVVGVIVDGNTVVALETNVAANLRDPFGGTVDNPVTLRLQIEPVIANPYIEWDCPRGVSVLRYGKRGC